MYQMGLQHLAPMTRAWRAVQLSSHPPAGAKERNGGAHLPRPLLCTPTSTPSLCRREDRPRPANVEEGTARLCPYRRDTVAPAGPRPVTPSRARHGARGGAGGATTRPGVPGGAGTGPVGVICLKIRAGCTVIGAASPRPNGGVVARSWRS